jgi:hypothetical protein
LSNRQLRSTYFVFDKIDVSHLRNPHRVLVCESEKFTTSFFFILFEKISCIPSLKFSSQSRTFRKNYLFLRENEYYVREEKRDIIYFKIFWSMRRVQGSTRGVHHFWSLALSPLILCLIICAKISICLYKFKRSK